MSKFGIAADRNALKILAVAVLFVFSSLTLAERDVLTQHNDNHRTGANLTEATLTVSNVRKKFHKVKELVVDPASAGGPALWAAQIVAQPLVVSDVKWADGSSKEVVVLATMHGTIAAYDAANDFAPLWACWLGPVVQDLSTVENGVWHATDQKDGFGTNPEWGILSTPVIDKKSGQIFASVWSSDNGGTFRLVAVDVITGRVVRKTDVSASVTDSSGKAVAFHGMFQKQRPGLLLLKPSDLAPDHQADVVPMERCTCVSALQLRITGLRITDGSSDTTCGVSGSPPPGVRHRTETKLGYGSRGRHRPPTLTARFM